MKNFYDFFPKKFKRSAQKRLQLVQNLDFNASNSYLKFNYDYFDNKDSIRGYGNYIDDSRYVQTVRKLISNYNLNSKSTVLEIGCAKGFLLNEFLKNKINIIGMDKSEYAINLANTEIKDKLKIHDIINGIPLEKNSVDLLIMKEILPHVEYKYYSFIFEEIKRVTNNKNIFIEIQIVSNPKYNEYFFKWDPTHKTLLSENEWLELFEKYKLNCICGFNYLF